MSVRRWHHGQNVNRVIESIKLCEVLNNSPNFNAPTSGLRALSQPQWCHNGLEIIFLSALAKCCQGHTHTIHAARVIEFAKNRHIHQNVRFRIINHIPIIYQYSTGFIVVKPRVVVSSNGDGALGWFCFTEVQNVQCSATVIRAMDVGVRGKREAGISATVQDSVATCKVFILTVLSEFLPSSN